MQRLDHLMPLLCLVLLVGAAPARRAKRARLDRGEVLHHGRRSLADLPIELLHKVMDQLPLSDLLRWSQSSRYYAEHAKRVLHRRREAGRCFNAQWAYEQLPFGHAWFNATDRLAHFDYDYPIELEIYPHEYPEAVNTALLQEEDAMVGTVRALHRFLDRSLSSPMRFAVDASGWSEALALRSLRHLDSLTIASREQLWDSEHGLVWPRLRELAIVNDTFLVQSPLPQGLLHFATVLPSRRYLEALYLPTTLQTLSMVVADLVVFDAYVLDLPSGLTGLSLTSECLAHVELTHLRHLESLALISNALLSLDAVRLHPQAARQLTALHLAGDLFDLPHDFATLFPNLEVLHLRGRWQGSARPIFPRSLRLLQIQSTALPRQLDLSPYPYLTEVWLTFCDLASLSAIFFPPNLTHLTLFGNRRLRSLTVDGQPRLPSSLLSLNVGDTDIRYLGLEELPATLQTLRATHNVLDYIQLADFIHLRRLDLSYTMMGPFSTKELPPYLNTLHLVDNFLIDATLNGAHASLEELSLSIVAINSRVDLRNASNLQQLHLAIFGFQGVRSIQLPPSLRYVHLDTIDPCAKEPLIAALKTLPHLQSVQDTYGVLDKGDRLPCRVLDRHGFLRFPT